MPQLPLNPYHNQQLFSDYFLAELLPQRAEWRALVPAAAALLPQIAALYSPDLAKGNEAQLEIAWVQPILRLLGHTFEVQAALKTPDGTKKPDYVLYRDEAAVIAQRGETLSDARLAAVQALAVGDAKAWGRSLDMTLKGSGDPFSNKNPSYQIAFYIQHSGLDWGILTNGRLWRLYHRETAHKLDRFYEVDLEALILAGDATAFLYFLAFFRRTAFDVQPLGLAAILRQSQDYARAVGTTLKNQVYTALRHVAQGFLDYPPNRLNPDAATLKAVYDNSLILLYRILFILYAEARDLLPLRESDLYRDDYSLDSIKRSVARDLNSGKRLLPSSARIAAQLRDLFRIIDGGSPPLKVATFNGGLFDANRHPLLETYSVGDERLQQALDLLVRVDGQFVDYRDLAERQLGTIYEGLLEFQLVPLVPATSTFSIALENDKGERKASGSYYTPDYIVKFIVEHTVGPILHQSVANATTDQEKIAAVLAINVLDPAMGSGHFLVEATEYIARFLVDLGVSTGTEAQGEAEVSYWKRRVVQSCIYGVDLNPLAVDLAKLSLWLITVAKDRPLSFLDHHLRTGNALVGARIDTLGAAAPTKSRQPKANAAQLSLLDDDTFRRTMSSAVDSMFLIETSAGVTVDEVKQQERAYTQLRDELTRRYGALANLATASAFGLALDATWWPVLADYAAGRRDDLPPSLLTLLESADRLATERHFFHWELEFPEVFFNRHGYPLGAAAGFDAVVGNPPYVRQEELAPFKPYFAAKYPDVYHGVADLFVYFFASGLRQARDGGRLAYISSNSWLRANYAQPLRTLLRTTTTVEALVDLGDNRVFADAPDVYPAIHVVRREIPPAQHNAQAAVFTRGEGLHDFATQVQRKMSAVSMHDQRDAGWQLGADAERQLFAKLQAHGRPLGEVINGQMYYGVKTGLNEAFIIDTATRNRLIQADAKSAELIKPLLRGEDLRPWYQEDEGRWLIALPNGWTRSQFGKGLNQEAAWDQFSQFYPSLAHHLVPFADAAKKRTDQGEYWWELRSCDYYDAFDQPKIFWPDIGKTPRFSWDDTGFWIGNTGYIATTNDYALLGLLASRCAWFLISNIATPFGERAGTNRYRLIDQYMRILPIPTPTDDVRASIAQLAQEISANAKARYALHERVRRRISQDLGGGGKLNQKLSAWWERDFAGFRAEIHKHWKTDIPLRDRDDWQEWLAIQRANHAQFTAAIIAGETQLNAQVYGLFGLSAAEIALIEASTKYQYGEV